MIRCGEGRKGEKTWYLGSTHPQHSESRGFISAHSGQGTLLSVDDGAVNQHIELRKSLHRRKMVVFGTSVADLPFSGSLSVPEHCSYPRENQADRHAFRSRAPRYRSHQLCLSKVGSPGEPSLQKKPVPDGLVGSPPFALAATGCRKHRFPGLWLQGSQVTVSTV